MHRSHRLMIKKHILPEGVVMYSVLMFYLKAFYAVPAGYLKKRVGSRFKKEEPGRKIKPLPSLEEY